MLPDKLAAGKYLMELEPAKDGADDLTGDAGAVGRMLVSGQHPPQTAFTSSPCDACQLRALPCQCRCLVQML